MQYKKNGFNVLKILFVYKNASANIKSLLAVFVSSKFRVKWVLNGEKWSINKDSSTVSFNMSFSEA